MSTEFPGGGAARLLRGRQGQDFTAGMWNESVDAINRLNGHEGRRNTKQKGTEGAISGTWTLVAYTTQSVQVPIEDDQGQPTGEFARADLILTRDYRIPDGTVIRLDDSLLLELYP